MRLAAGDVGSLSLRELLVNGPVVRAVTEGVSVRKMHAFADSVRKNGGEIFFAALED